MKISIIIEPNNRLSYKILDAITLLLILLVFIPQFQVLHAYNYFLLGLEIAWLVVAALIHPKFFLGGDKYFLQSFFLTLITVVIPLIFNIQTIANRYSTFIAIPLFYWIYCYNSAYRGLKPNIRIGLLSLIPIVYTSFQTISELLINPYAARLIKTSGDQSVALWSRGISGYSLIYATVILLLILIPLIIERRKLMLNIYSFFLTTSLTFSFIVLIILSNYFTALIIVSFGVLMYITFYLNKKLLFFIFIGFFMLYSAEHKVINKTVIETIIYFVPQYGKTHERLDAIRNSIVYDIELKDLDTRSETRKASLDLFSKYPLGGYIVASNNNIFDLDKVGQHSYILDTYALFGLFIGTFAFWIMWLPFKYLIKQNNIYRLKVFTWIIGISFILILLNNNLTPSIGFATFFIFPTVYEYLKLKIYV